MKVNVMCINLANRCLCIESAKYALGIGDSCAGSPYGCMFASSVLVYSITNADKF